MEALAERHSDIGKAQVTVIVVSWNNLLLLDECFQSVYRQTYTNWNIILVDNGSADDTVPYVRSHHPRVRIIEAGKNLGFAVANNLGISEAFKNQACAYVMLLNTDATIAPDWLEVMVKFADTKPKGAGFQSLTVDYYDHRIIDSAGILMSQDALATQIAYREKNLVTPTTIVFGVNAAAALYSRRFLEAQPFGDNYFDHDFFMYLEDVDLATRATMMGWNNYMVEGTTAYHMGSASSGKNPGFSLYLTYRNNWPTLIKNLPWKIIYRTLPGMIRAECARLRAFTLEGRFRLVWAILKGRVVSLRLLPLMLRKRQQLKPYRNISVESLWELMAIPHYLKRPAATVPFGDEMVTIVVLSSNHVTSLQLCLDAIFNQTYPNANVIVVDNASTDGSQRLLTEANSHLTTLLQEKNLGVANGFNVGITAALKAGQPDYIALIEADVILSADWTTQSLHTIRSNDEAFCTSTKLKYDHGTVYGYEYKPGRQPHLAQKKPLQKQVFAPTPGAFMVRSEFIGPVGFMDGDFFQHYAEVDWALRARLQGYGVLSSLAEATIKSVDPTDRRKDWYQRSKNSTLIFLNNLPLKVIVMSAPLAMVHATKHLITGIKRGYAVESVKLFIKIPLRFPRIVGARRRVNRRRRMTAASLSSMIKLLS